MIFSNAKYIAGQVIKDGEYVTDLSTNVAIEATLDEEVWTIPIVADNTMYIEIMKQVNAGTLNIEAAS